MESGGSDATVPVIGAIDAISSLGVGNVLVAIGGSGANDAICGGGTLAAIRCSGASLGTDTLGVGGDDIILGVDDLGTSGRCSSGGSGMLVTGKGGSGVSTAGGSILGIGTGGGSDRVSLPPLS
jgi:hypothetical protein